MMLSIIDCRSCYLLHNYLAAILSIKGCNQDYSPSLGLDAHPVSRLLERTPLEHVYNSDREAHRALLKRL